MTCTRCQIEKTVDEFQVERATGNRRTICRRCYQRVTSVQWAKHHPIRKSAHYYVSKAIKDGKLVRSEVCENCGRKTYTVAHHSDYSKPLKVNWLCDRCHRNHHIAKERKRKK